jgi:hypothetical protein
MVSLVLAHSKPGRDRITSFLALAETMPLCMTYYLYMRLTRRFIIVACALLAISPLLAAVVGNSVGNGILHPMRLNAMRLQDTQKMLARTGATKEDFSGPV